MWLRHYSELHARRRAARRGSLALLLAMGLAGCASGPGPQSGDRSEEMVTAETSYEERLKQVPPEALTLFEQATAIMAAGDFTDAELRFKEFVLQYPEYPGAHVNLAIIRARSGDDEAAEAHLTDALDIDPEHPAALNQLGVLLRREGKFVEAEAAYLKAVTASPDYALAHYNLGVLNELYFQRLDVALQHFEFYQKIDGEDQQVSKWIADLKRRLGARQSAANMSE